MDVIKLLKIELSQKEQELIKAAEMMKFYKLELVNRENNFNKVFNAQPNIGLMNPFDTKVLHAIRNPTSNKPPRNPWNNNGLPSIRRTDLFIYKIFKIYIIENIKFKFEDKIWFQTIINSNNHEETTACG